MQELSCDPLALAQASATIASSGVNCRDYREIFATRREQIAEASGEQPAAKAVTWTLAMECADELAPGGGAQLCLALAVLLGCQGIPEAVFSADAAAEFIAGPGTGAAGAGRAGAGLLSLQRTGLLTIDPGSPVAPGRLVRVHPAVQAGVRSAMPDSMRDHAALAAAAALLQSWPDQAEQSPLACSLRACVTSLDQAAGDVLWTGEAHQVLLRAGQSLDSARLTQPAVRHWRAVAETSERVLGAAHPDTLLAGSRLASATLAAGDGAEAVVLYQRFLDAQAGVLGPDHPRVAAAQAEFGNALLAWASRPRRSPSSRRRSPPGSATAAPWTSSPSRTAWRPLTRPPGATRTRPGRPWPRWSSASEARDLTTGRRWPPGGTWRAPTWPRASPRTPSRTAAAPSKAPNGRSDLTILTPWTP